MSDGGRLRALMVGFVSLFASACLELREEPTDAAVNKCTDCHGSAAREGEPLSQSAPPRNVDGQSSIDAPGVGAHQVHLTGGGRAAPVECATCHVVPTETYSPGHIDTRLPAEVELGGRAALDDHDPTYAAATGTCTDSYCHRDAEPEWLAPRSGEDACGTCHALPPAAPHPASSREGCADCHGAVVRPDGTFADASLHVNGVVEMGELGCGACHGSDATGAPPVDLAGNLETTAPGVGAHQLHLNAGTTHGAIACGECHEVPAAVDDPGHLDEERPAELVFGALARTGGAAPDYDAAARTCSSSYCHGEAAPVWNAPRDSATACGSCHGLPPAAPHPQSDRCSDCHGAVIDAAGDFVDPELHVNGVVDVGDLGCSACHGSGTQGAPPPDLGGSTLVSSRGVGAHAAHLVGGPTHEAVACSACHRVPTAVADAGHLDATPNAELIFGALAQTGGANPVWSTTALTCASTYCHGSATPEWTAPRDSAEACGTCHGTPPPAPHPQRTQCGECHSAVMDLAGTFIAPGLHVNGVVELDTMSCSSCHGSPAGAAPPAALDGETAVTARGVGAHDHHLTASATHTAVACSECHVVPTDVDDAGHIDPSPNAELNFGTLALTGGASPVWSTTALTCANTYCHGGATPEWTAPRDSAAACGSCHGAPPPAPHPQRDQCGDCHGTVMDASGAFIAPELHVNGVVDLGSMSCSACHGSTTNAAPPLDIAGSSLASARGVGAHQLHLAASPTHGPVACTECHQVPSAVDEAGHRDTSLPAELVFGTLATLGGASPTYSGTALTCAGSYCHGAATPVWTAPAADPCGSCHALPPPAPHPPLTACSRCHGEVIDAAGSFVAPTRHVDGNVDVTLTCSSCHGSGTNAAPPAALDGSTARTSPGVGAHQTHLTGGRYGRPVTCGECHVVPVTTDDPGHIDDWGTAEVLFSGPGTTNGPITFDSGALTCAGSYCHGPLDSAATSPAWTSTTPLGCQDCHPTPPPAPGHPTNPACESCHGAVVDSSLQIIDRTRHIDGEVTFNF